jgi:hypothetical protein
MGGCAASFWAEPDPDASHIWIGGAGHWKGWSSLRLMANFAQALLPLQFVAWIAFTISFALPKLTTILDVLSSIGMGPTCSGRLIALNTAR